eukprot:m.69958 g.69958  ORF g.69958 m.69958 type:complete len:399 (-) comp12244_c0_seq1:660-1856(-)
MDQQTMAATVRAAPKYEGHMQSAVHLLDTPSLLGFMPVHHRSRVISQPQQKRATKQSLTPHAADESVHKPRLTRQPEVDACRRASRATTVSQSNPQDDCEVTENLVASLPHPVRGLSRGRTLCDLTQEEDAVDFEVLQWQRRSRARSKSMDAANLRLRREAVPQPQHPPLVHWRDSNGVSLTDSKLFNAEDEPCQCSPVLRRRRSFTPPPPQRSIVRSHPVSHDKRPTSPDTMRSADDPANDVFLSTTVPAPRVRLLTPPITDQADILAAVQARRVALEHVTIRDPFVFVSVRVLNVCFEKEVMVRFTCDEWATHHDIHAQHLPGLECPLTDRFYATFTAPKTAATMHFAICYKANGVESWDNNDGQNYTIVASPECKHVQDAFAYRSRTLPFAKPAF